MASALAIAPETRLINGYGPTENTTFTCCYTIPRDFPPGVAVPIGAPIPRTECHVLDELRQVVSELIHVPAAAMPVGAAVAAPVVGDATETLVEQARYDVVPLIGVPVLLLLIKLF